MIIITLRAGLNGKVNRSLHIRKIHEVVLKDMFSFSLLKIIKFENENSVVLLNYDPNWGYVIISIKQC